MVQIELGAGQGVLEYKVALTESGRRTWGSVKLNLNKIRLSPYDTCFSTADSMLLVEKRDLVFRVTLSRVYVEHLSHFGNDRIRWAYDKPYEKVVDVGYDTDMKRL